MKSHLARVNMLQNPQELLPLEKKLNLWQTLLQLSSLILNLIESWCQFYGKELSCLHQLTRRVCFKRLRIQRMTTASKLRLNLGRYIPEALVPCKLHTCTY